MILTRSDWKDETDGPLHTIGDGRDAETGLTRTEMHEQMMDDWEAMMDSANTESE